MAAIHQEKCRALALITSPISRAGCTPTSNLIDIFADFVEELHLLTGNDGFDCFKDDNRIYIHGINHKKYNNCILRLSSFLKIQLLFSFFIIHYCKKIPILVFFIADDFILPIILAKFLGKRVILISAGSPVLSLKTSHDLLYLPLYWIVRIDFILADKIIVYSERQIFEYNLSTFSNKIIVAPRHFINLQKNTMHENLDERKNIIGYLGRFSEEKGVLNLIQAAKIISQDRNDIQFVLTGDGPLKERMQQYIDENNLNSIVILKEWINHEDISLFLKSIKLLLIPSFTEGLPNVLLESMAAGVPVLATPVGAIPDIIIDEYNGFIMENNNPPCISKNIRRAIEFKQLNDIAKNGYELIEKKFTFTIVSTNYRSIFLNGV